MNTPSGEAGVLFKCDGDFCYGYHGEVPVLRQPHHPAPRAIFPALSADLGNARFGTPSTHMGS